MATSDVQPLLEQAASAYQQEDYAMAQALAGQACKKAPGNLDAWDFHGMTCQELGDAHAAATSYKKALKLARKAYKKNPRDGKMALRQLFLLMRLDRKGDIETLLALLQERHPDSPGLKKLVATYRLNQT
jgi:tetratricopeptide (TPR) repeat protein